jgi:hypothetical protein
MPNITPFKAAAASFAVEPIAGAVRDTSELESVVAALASEPNGGLIVMPDAFMAAHPAEVNAVADRYRLPLVSSYRFYTEHGGLLSYGISITDNYPRAAAYADRILKGEKPSELPVQAPVKFQLVVNLRTAKALGASTCLRRCSGVPTRLSSEGPGHRPPRLQPRGVHETRRADANHSSFGCEDRVKWTYFGDAFFNVALRRTTRLKDAFALARALVGQREARNGFVPSHPQMAGGENVEPLLITRPGFPPSAARARGRAAWARARSRA